MLLTTAGAITFNRTDSGDIARRTVIAGPRTGVAHFRQVAVDPGTGRIFLAQQSMREKPLKPVSPRPTASAGKFEEARHTRHTDQRCTVDRGLTGADCFREIEEDEIFLANNVTRQRRLRNLALKSN